MDARIAAACERLGTNVVLLGHHYQRDEVIRFADFTGDSYKLSKVAAETNAKYMVFCGVHFMAETADVLGQPWQQVILPDLNAGCSMADMAEIGQVEDCWDSLVRQGLGDVVPVTYMNSAAAIKGFCGKRGGLVCTSSNARGAFEWAFARGGEVFVSAGSASGTEYSVRDGDRAGRDGGGDPYQINGGVSPDRLKAAKVILWKGHCSVHQRFLPEHVDRVCRDEPGMQVMYIRSAAGRCARRPIRLGRRRRLSRRSRRLLRVLALRWVRRYTW